MEKIQFIINMIKGVITDVLMALYQPFWFSLLAASLFMFAYMQYKKNGLKKIILQWMGEFKSNKEFRRCFMLAFYVMLILFRTLLNRNMWENPLTDVFGSWWIWKKDVLNGEIVLTTECFQNIIMFIPFTFMVYFVKYDEIKNNNICLKTILLSSFKIGFMFSLIIEFLQLFLRVGTFQLSDLFYNTLGSIIGGIIYWLYYRSRCNIGE